MSEHRREVVLGELQSTTDGFLATVAGLTPAQWAWVPAPGRWSVGLTAEHITVVLRGVGKLLSQKLLQMPLPATDDGRISDDRVVTLMFNRNQTIQAPEAVRPTGRWGSGEDCVAAFREARDGMMQWVAGNTEDLRRFGAPHPIMGTLDGVQWLLFVAAHTERHTRQIQETRLAAGFPLPD